MATSVPDAPTVPDAPASSSASARPRPEVCALAASVPDALALRAAGAGRVYVDVASLDAAGRDRVRAEGIVPALGEVCREPDHALLDPWAEQGLPVAVANLSELALARARGARPEVLGCVPVHNVATLRLLGRLGVGCTWLSPELSLGEIRELAALAGAGHPVPDAADAAGSVKDADGPLAERSATGVATPLLGATAYGRPRLMTCEHCVLQVAYDCDRDHAACPYRARPHWLVNIDGRRLPVQTDARGRSRVYLDEPIDLVARAAELARAGVSRMLVDARAVTLADAEGAVRRLARELDAPLVAGPASAGDPTSSAAVPVTADAHAYVGMIDRGVL